MRISDNALRVPVVTAIIQRSPWTAVAGVAQDSGNHKHLVATHVTTDTENIPCAVNASTHSGNATLAVADYRYANTDDPASGSTFTMGVAVGSGSQGNWYTEGNSGAHSHPTEFTEVQQDTTKPEDCSLVVNGTSVATGLFPEQTGDDVIEVDITPQVLSKSGGWRGFHDLTINCATGRGDLQVTIYIDMHVTTVLT